MPASESEIDPPVASFSEPTDGAVIQIGEEIDVDFEVTIDVGGVLDRIDLSVTQPDGVTTKSWLTKPSGKRGEGHWKGSATLLRPGQATLSTKVYYTVENNKPKQTGLYTISIHSPPPWVSITYPTDGVEIPVPPGGGDLAVTVETNADQRVEFSIDNWSTVIGETFRRPRGATLHLPETVPVSYTLQARAYDTSGAVSVAQSTFKTIDKYAPVIVINAPLEGKPILSDKRTFLLVAGGTAIDAQSQSGMPKPQYTVDGQNYTDVDTFDAAGQWSVTLQLPDYGYYTLRLRATDAWGNVAVLDRKFEHAAAYTPRTLDELLSPRSYLQALLKFIRSHLVNTRVEPDGAPLDSDLLKKAFFQSFGELAQPTTDVGSQVLNSLHVPVQVAQMYLADAASLGPVVAEWNFDEATGTSIVDSGPYENNGELGTGATWGQGPTSGALDFTATGSAIVPHASTSLLLGNEDHDFSMSFWLYLRTGATGEWRAIIFKGSEQERTPGLWMRDTDNRIHFRITTEIEWNAGADSVGFVSTNRWTHVTYVKAGGSLKLYLDGRLDACVHLVSKSRANVGPVYLGKSDWWTGIDGAVDDIRIYSFALPEESVRRLAIDRFSPSRRTLLARATRAQLQAAYSAVLGGLGTSFAELRLLPTLTPAQRSNLASRLGLRSATPDVDHLADLLPRSTGLTEAWLEDLFGVPSTSRDPFQPAAYPPPLFLKWRQEALLADWLAADQATPETEAQPFLDPDLVDSRDLTVSDRDDVLVKTLATRQVWIDQQRASILSAGTSGGIGAAVQLVLGAADLNALVQREAAGESIAPELDALRLTGPAFRRLVALGILAKGSTLTDAEWDEVADILTTVRRRQQLAQWQAEESALALWPGGLRVSYYPRSFVPWRASFADRHAWQARVARRQTQWTGLGQSLLAAVASAGQQALPILRDGILAGRFGDEVAPAIADELSERLLVDLNSAGATRLTRIDQAVTTLQSLVNGIRTGRFHGEHPAASWKIHEPEPKNPSPDAVANFEEEWKWMGSFGSWRAAMSVFLYPENNLLPSLPRVDGSEAFGKLVEKLRSTPRLKGDSAQAIFDHPVSDDTDNTGLTIVERTYFAPMVLGLELQKAGAFATALGWYRKVYDSSRTADTRAVAALLAKEKNSAPAPEMDDHWTRTSLDPHVNAATGKWGNPYTRFTLGTIIQCLLSYADSEYAGGTLDSLSNALGLYLSAKELLNSPELDLVPPTLPDQIFIPNPLFEALRAHVDSALRKLRRGLSFAGLPMPADPTRSQGGTPGDDGLLLLVATSTRPTPYRFRVLIERAKQLAAQAEQFEAQYLTALEKRDLESEKLLRDGSTLQIGRATVALQQRRLAEAVDGSELARRQRARASISTDRYSGWIAVGASTLEKAQVGSLWDARLSRDIVTAAEVVQSAASAVEGAGAEPWNIGAAAVAVGAAVAKGLAQGTLNLSETSAQVNGILAAQERRQQEWELQRDVARQDELVGDQQIVLTTDHEKIAEQEFTIADMQARQAQTMVEFLRGKFTSEEFYAWLAGKLAATYEHFLQLAASIAKLAEDQLAFERQERPAGVIGSDYWKETPFGGQTGDTGAPDRRGISGSARLLQDLSSVDQLAFDSERRLLNLTQMFSLARMAPLEFQQFKGSGVLPFTTTAQVFDEGFPGHYLRLIKRVRVSVVALIPPSTGIRATLLASGISRVVAGPPMFSAVTVRQDPEWVALTSPTNASGVFELDQQSDLLLPFEGMGVDTSWTFEMPRAGNSFDFQSVADVLVTIEYTARNSVELRDRVIERLPPQRSGDIAWSVRQDLPDAWYDLNNRSDATAQLQIPLALSKRDYPPQLQNLSVDQIVVAVRSIASVPDVAAIVTPSFVVDTMQQLDGLGVPLRNGSVSTRSSAATAWSKLIGTATAFGNWTFALADDPSATDKIGDRLRAGEIEDILIVFTFSGSRPAW